MSHVHEWYRLPDYARVIRPGVIEFAYVCVCNLNVSTLAPCGIGQWDVADQVTVQMWGGQIIGYLRQAHETPGRDRQGAGGYVTLSELKRMCGMP